jgi:hypothetical protein
LAATPKTETQTDNLNETDIDHIDLNKMPDWNPAVLDNILIDHRVTFSITFKLHNE